ncbi:terminase large subunit domain-containing protein, partial [Nocardioides aquaticus]
MSAPEPADALALLYAFRVDTGPATRAVPWGNVATERQVEDARAVIMEPGSWHMWLRPRGGSKTQDASLVALACLLTIQPPNSRSLVYAVDKDQAALMMEKLGHLAKALPEDLRVTGDRVTNIATQAFLTVETSDAPSALGHTPWLVVVDEFCAWPDRRGPRLLWQAVVSSMPKRPDSRLLVISSAGDPGNWTHDVVRSARTGTDWRFSYMQGPCPWWSEVDVARQRGALSDAAYSWYILNEFAAAENALVGADDLTASVARGVKSRPYDPAHRYAIGVDLGRKVDASVVAVAHREGDAVVVDHVERWLPTRLSPVRLETVEAAIRRLQAEYGHAHVRMDPAKGEMLSQRLGEDGLAVEEYVFSEASVDRLAALVSRLFGERRITVPDLPALVEELGTVVLRTTPGGRSRIDHHSGKHDDQVVAIALAAHWLMAQVSFGTGFVSNAREMVRGPR